MLSERRTLSCLRVPAAASMVSLLLAVGSACSSDGGGEAASNGFGAGPPAQAAPVTPIGTGATSGTGGAAPEMSAPGPDSASNEGSDLGTMLESPAGGAGGSAGGGAGAAESVDAKAMVEAMGFGTNIGNTLENTTTWETGWGQPLITEAFIQGIASRGIRTVRVPVAWDTYANGGVVDAANTARVKEVVSWIESAGMYAIVNIHWDGGWIDNENGAPPYALTDAVKAKFVSYWQQIGTAFADVGHHLVLEGMNEEGRWTTDGTAYGTPDIPALDEMNQLFVTTARASGGYNATRALLIAGFNTDIAKTCVTAFTVPDDPAGPGKLFLSIHYYDPYTFTLMEDPADWGSPTGTWGADAEVATLQNHFDQLDQCSKGKNIPIILGEFAVTHGTNVPREPAARAAWMARVAEATAARGIVPVLWDTGSEINRADGAFSSELQTAVDAFQAASPKL